MRLIARPIDEWPDRHLTPDSARSFSRFSASWTDTVDILDRELHHLGASEAVLQLAITERECRLDGWIRANAKPEHPGVIISFESVHGPLRYWTDEFKWGGSGHLPGWQANVRAIALGLEALRKVDRYGIARRGEQYRGWNALPPGTPMPPGKMTVDEAVEVLIDAGSAIEIRTGEARDLVRTDPTVIGNLYRAAARLHHPDAGGDPAMFRRITEARDLLLEGTAR